jgi:hypothetical protein
MAHGFLRRWQRIAFHTRDLACTRVLFFFAQMEKNPAVSRPPRRKKHKANRRLQKIKYRGLIRYYPDHRAFESILKIVHIFDALYTAVEFTNAGDPVSKSTFPVRHLVASDSFAVDVQMPTKTPMEYLARGELPRYIDLVFVHNILKSIHLYKVEKKANLQLFVTGLITPIFIDFFEQHADWVKDKFRGDANKNWPPIANFVRVIRNFIVHHQGKVSFENRNAPIVSWHHLSYGPQDEGCLAVGFGGDLGLGDLIILLLEFAEELDGWGCPHLPLTVPTLEILAKARRQGLSSREYDALAAKYMQPPPSKP